MVKAMKNELLSCFFSKSGSFLFLVSFLCKFFVSTFPLFISAFGLNL